MDECNDIAEALAYGKKMCSGSESASLDAQLLLMHVLNCDRAYIMSWSEKTLTEHQKAHYLQLLAQRAAGLPVAHVIGQREFWTLVLDVNDSTLIPRPETEQLVETALHHIRTRQAQVLELGTGTGAISLALAAERPEWQIIATDKSVQAVTLAEQNRDKHQLPNVQLVQSDWFENALIHQKYDLIISNPPYISHNDKHLSQGDVRFEPKSALVAENYGLADLALIIEQALSYLKPEGMVILEHGHAQGEAVRNLFLQAGYTYIQTLQDYANLDRVTFAKWPDEPRASKTEQESPDSV